MFAKLLEGLALLPKCHEREQIRSLLQSARRLSFSQAASASSLAVADALPWTIESCLHFIQADNEPVWIEFSENVIQSGGNLRNKGFLAFFSNDDNPNLFIMPAWQQNDNVFHSRAMIAISLNAMHALGELSRYSLSKNRDEAIERMMALVQVYCPENFKAELSALAIETDSNRSPEDLTRLAMQDAAAETIVALGALLLSKAKTATVSMNDGGSLELELKSEGRGLFGLRAPGISTDGHTISYR